VQLHRELPRIHALGAELVAIGTGKPHWVAGFRELTEFSGLILCDPAKEAYQAAHMERGRWRDIFNPRTLAYGMRAVGQGMFQGRVQGDPKQNGGVLVVAPPGHIVFRQVSQVAGDHAKVEDILQALEALPRDKALTPRAKTPLPHVAEGLRAPVVVEERE
jgi:hypothetical protein